MSEFNKFFRSTVIIGIILFLVWLPMLIFNVVIDPYGIFFWTNRKSLIEPNKRVMKVRYITKNPSKYDSFIFGSSRANAINPDKIPNDKYFNMTYSAGSPANHYQDLVYMVNKGVNIKNLIIGIDYLSLIENHEVSEMDLLRMKFPESVSEKIAFYKRYLFNNPNWNFVKQGLNTSNVDKKGIYENGIVFSKIDSIINSDIKKHVNKIQFEIPSSSYQHSERKNELEAIRSIIRFSRANKINLIIFINPIHYKTFMGLNLSSYFKSLKLLAEETSFYDFGGINSITIENLNYNETSHFRQQIGDLIIDRLFHLPNSDLPKDFGIIVNASNIEEYIREQENRFKKYIYTTSLDFDDGPFLDICELRRKTIKPQYKIETINGISNFSKPFQFSSPFLIIKGQRPKNTEDFKAYVEINNSFFPILQKNNSNKINEKTKNNESHLHWEVIIPTYKVPQSKNWLKIVLANDEIYDISDSIAIDNLISIQPISSMDNMTFLGETSFHVDNLTNPYYMIEEENEQSGFLFITGWASDILKGKSSGGIIARINGHLFQSQIVYKRPDLEKHFANPFLTFAGWGILIPKEVFREGENQISYIVLSEDKSGYYLPRIHTRIIKGLENHSILKELPVAEFEAKFSIDIINNVRVQSNGNAIVIDQQNFNISGWAVDDLAKLPASKVFLSINDKHFEVTYGLSRPDVSKAFDNKNYELCGWNLSLPIKLIGVGEHIFGIKIISNDEKHVFTSAKKYKIIVLE